MIKGVNKRIVEINNTDSIYFEKAVFYLRPNVRELPVAVTENEIRKYVSRLGLQSRYSAPKRSARTVVMLIIALAAALGIALAFLL